MQSTFRSFVFGALALCMINTQPSNADWLAGSNIETVQNGAMNSLPNVSIKKIIDLRFDDGNWTELESDLGEITVDFQGTISQKLQDRLVGALVDLHNSIQDTSVLAYQVLEMSYRLTAVDKQLITDKVNGYTDPDKREREIALEVVRIISAREYFVIGTPAQIQWAVNPSDNSFVTTYLGSEAWAQFRNEDQIFDIVFGR